MNKELLKNKFYIGAYSAAIHWHLLEPTDFTSIAIENLRFLSLGEPFGIVDVKRSSKTLLISNPTRTIVDLLNKPKLVENIYLVEKALVNYVNSKHRNFELMFDYAERFPSGAFYKRLGFLLERNFPNENEILSHCLAKISKGYSYLDTRETSNKIISKWNLWISQEMKSNVKKLPAYFFTGM
jgi:predicted transcriptional regulator of viral defense system